jgi:hypothetical protein
MAAINPNPKYLKALLAVQPAFDIPDGTERRPVIYFGFFFFLGPFEEGQFKNHKSVTRSFALPISPFVHCPSAALNKFVVLKFFLFFCFFLGTSENTIQFTFMQVHYAAACSSTAPLQFLV